MRKETFHCEFSQDPSGCPLDWNAVGAVVGGPRPTLEVCVS